MADPAIPPNADEIEAAVNEALHGLELEPHETASILGFANEELPHLQTPETTYYVLGSYRDPYVRRLRRVENELNKRLSAYAFVMGDLREIGLDRLPEFRIRFQLLAAYADYIVGVYEQDAGGEVTELGKISETPYFEKSYVLPRDYCWMTGENFDGKADVVAAAMEIWHSEDLTDEQTADELESLVAEAQESGIGVSEGRTHRRGSRARTRQHRVVQLGSPQRVPTLRVTRSVSAVGRRVRTPRFGGFRADARPTSRLGRVGRVYLISLPFRRDRPSRDPSRHPRREPNRSPRRSRRRLRPRR
ncbi:hypothetical protein [Halorussus caseinilyticus]|uniref:Uncharacterized protein n=1 Tax=Halorussus caseinilyticus TaxID=3034025 RepID=A0ABD5WUN6_9EURY